MNFVGYLTHGNVIPERRGEQLADFYAWFLCKHCESLALAPFTLISSHNINSLRAVQKMTLKFVKCDFTVDVIEQIPNEKCS